MSTETPTPETDQKWTALVYPDGTPRENWRIVAFSYRDLATRFERERDLAIKDRDEAVQLFTQELNKAVERIKSHGTSPKSRT